MFSYILLENSLKLFSTFSGFIFYKKDINKITMKGSSTFLKYVSIGVAIHHLENKPGSGAKFNRAAGTKCYIFFRDFINKIFTLKLKSGWLLKLSYYCIVVIGLVSNLNNKNLVIKKAGFKRKLGFRPKVRGVAMNPCDHPHGGGEGKKSQLASPKTPWGKATKFVSTRKYKIKLKKWN